MKRGSYRVIECGGKYNGHESSCYTSDELVLNREDIAYVLKALRRGNDEDKKFATRMFNTLMPHTHCDCCGRRIVTADQESHTMYGKTLCYKCWFIMTDIDHILSMQKDGFIKDPITCFKSTQKVREKWCPKKINYLVNERTYDCSVKKYKELFGEEPQ